MTAPKNENQKRKLKIKEDFTMKKIDANVVNNLFVAYVDHKGVFFIRENETLHDFAMKVFKELKTENTKSIEVYPYGNLEGNAILEYYNDHDEGEDLWVIPENEK